MFIPTTVPIYFEECSETVSNQSIDYQWTLPINPVNRAVMYGETISTQVTFDPAKERSTSNNIVIQRMYDDSISRKRIWERVFVDIPMPETQENAVEESFGLLDECFAGSKLTPEQVSELLKKAK